MSLLVGILMVKCWSRDHKMWWYGSLSDRWRIWLFVVVAVVSDGMDGDDHGSKKSTPLHPLQHALKKRKRTTLILTILLSRGHSWIFHRWQMTPHVPLNISFLGEEDCLYRCSCPRCTAAYDPLPTISYCRMLQKSNRAKMLRVLVVRSNWPPKVYTGTGHVQYYHALPILAGIQDSVSANSNNLIASCEFEQLNLQAKNQETTRGHFPIKLFNLFCFFLSFFGWIR